MTRLERAELLRGRLDALALVKALELGAQLDMSQEDVAAARLLAIGSAPVPEIPEGGDWAPGLLAVSGRRAVYGGRGYDALVSHMTQADWTPEAAPALWKAVRGEAEPWRQPQGAHDAYMRGDTVTHLGLLWESTADNNTWEPGVYGWKVV